MTEEKTIIKIKDLEFVAENIDWKVLEEKIVENNDSLSIFEVEAKDNFFLIDIERVKTFVDCINANSLTLGEVDISSDLNMLQSGFPDIDEDECNDIRWAFATSEIIEKGLRFLYIPSKPDDLKNVIGLTNEKISNLDEGIRNLTKQESDLRALRKNDPTELRSVLSDLHSSKRKQMLLLIHLRRLISLDLTSLNKSGEIFDELLRIDEKINTLNVMLF